MNSIRHRILFFTLLPFLAVYIALSVFIVLQIYNIQIRETKQQLNNMALYSETNLKKTFETLQLAAQISATELEIINPRDPAAREKGDSILTSRFQHLSFINVWLIFEPDAFDGRDSFHRDDYPGAPSGRYIRSFFWDGNSWITINDIDETVLTDMEESYYYVTPMKTGAFYTDLTDGKLWDYGFGPVSSFSVVMPVYRNGKAIGCVGFDALLNEDTLGKKIYPYSSTVIFLANGRVGFSSNTEIVDKNLEELGFSDSKNVMEHLSNNVSDYYYIGYSGISRIKSFIHFYPVEINGDYIYLYTSIPYNDAMFNALFAVLPIGSSFLISLIVFTLLFVYLSHGIAVPLKQLAEACENIVLGNLEMNIGVINTKDEIGMISKSLIRMIEQFRTNKFLQEQYYDRCEVILKIHYALFRNAALSDAFSAILNEISEYYNASRTSLIFIIDNIPKIVAVYPAVVREEGDSDFFAHSQVVNLLGEKKHLTMNNGAIKAAQLTFLDYNTKSLCLLPLRMHEILQGYIIMERKNPESIIHDDTTLLFLGDTIGYILGCKANWEQELASAAKNPKAGFSAVSQTTSQNIFTLGNAEIFFDRAKKIQNLDAEKGILLIGGEKTKYAELLKVTINVISDDIQKMRRFYTNDISAFAVVIHGMKGALYNIGAEILGDEARQLEFAAKSDDAEYCKENYPLFEEKLRMLSRNLTTLFPQQERSSRKGDTKELEIALSKALQACNDYDVSASSSLLAPLTLLKWEDETIQEKLQGIFSDIDNLEYDRMQEKITGLLDLIRGNST